MHQKRLAAGRARENTGVALASGGHHGMNPILTYTAQKLRTTKITTGMPNSSPDKTVSKIPFEYTHPE